jgi:circadian clock protein KaiC
MTSWQATSFLIGEYVNVDAEANPIMTVADGVFSLSQSQQENSIVRKIRIVKMRGQAHMSGNHTFRMGDDGLRIFPRQLPPLADDRHAGVTVDSEKRRISSGVPSLDILLHGGIPQGHSVLVAGPSGSGKTILGTLFLAEGVRQGEKGVAAYFEKGTSRLRNARLAEMVQAGDVTVVESRSLDLSIDELLEDMLDAIVATGAKRVVLDSLSEVLLYLAPEFRREFRLSVFRVLSSLAKLGVTVLVTLGMEDRFTELRFSEAEVSFLTDGIIAMRYVEMEGELRKVIAVVKMRGVSHSHALRTFRINDNGIEIDQTRVQFDGMLSGHPSAQHDES